jgi:nitronate monooxygenase
VSTALADLSVPIVLAPLAGGPATPELAVAVSNAGGLGFLAAGYKPTSAVGDEIAAFRRGSRGPLGVNVFSPPLHPSPPSAYADYVERIRAEADRLGIAVGSPRLDDDQFTDKVALLTEAKPEFASFVFGCPPADVILRLRQAGVTVLVTVTTPEEAEQAVAAGSDGLVVQGLEAGGHRGSASNQDQPAYGLLSLLQLIARRPQVPLVAAGGIASGSGVAAVLAAGATAAQIGTAFLRCPESGTSPVHRAAIAGAATTEVTRAFTGKPARGIVNRFMREFSADAPPAYPEIHHVTAPLRAAGRRSGDADLVNLWAGQAHALAREEPAAEVVARLMREAREALGSAARVIADGGAVVPPT